jgi:hypothetical protein
MELFILQMPIPGESGRSSVLIPLNLTKTQLTLLKTLKVHAGIPGSNKQHFQ